MIGVYAPSVESRSGIGLYGQLVLDILRGAGESAVLVDERRWADPRDFDDVLYNIGGGVVDWSAFAAARLRPGPVILHEHNLTEFFCRNEERLDADLWAEVAARRDRAVGAPLRGSLHAWLRADRRNQYLDLGLADIPVRGATAVLTHSATAAALLRRRHPAARVRVLDFPVADETTVPGPCRTGLGIPPTARVVGSFGFAAGNKHLTALVAAWRRIAPRETDAVLLLAGPGMSAFGTGGRDGVRVVDHVAGRGDFLALMRLVDVGVQLRKPSLGETSGTVSELLAMGRPVVVSDHTVLPTWADRRMVLPAGDDHSAEGLSAVLARLLDGPLPASAPVDAAATRAAWLATVRAATRRPAAPTGRT